MASKKSRKPAITGLSKPQGFADDFINQGIRQVVKAARKEIPKRAVKRRAAAAKEVLDLKSRAKGAAKVIRQTGVRAAEGRHINKQAEKILKTKNPAFIAHKQRRDVVTDFSVGDRMEDLASYTRYFLGDKGYKVPMKGVNKAKAAEERAAAAKFARARRAANRKSSGKGKK